MQAHAPGVALSAFGSAIVDGAVSPGEWDQAACADFTLAAAGESHASTFCTMNDETSLYMAIVIRGDDFKGSSFGVQGDILTLFFDNDHDGRIGVADSQHGDDFVQLQNGFLGFFLDAFTCLPPACAFRTFGQDVDFGGATDAVGAISHTNSVSGGIGDYVYEIRKTLNSGDAQHDFSLAPGSTVGVFLKFDDTPVGSNAGSPSTWPGPDACTAFGSATPCVGADIVIAPPPAPPAIDVAIDVKPGSDPNSIKRGEQGLLPVAILGGGSVDVTQIDPATIMLGGVTVTMRGSAKRPKLAYSYEDVNGDAFPDLVAFFDVPALVDAGALTESTAALVLTADLFDGGMIEGADSVRVVP